MRHSLNWTPIRHKSYVPNIRGQLPYKFSPQHGLAPIGGSLEKIKKSHGSVERTSEPISQGRATYPPNYTLKPLPERGLVPLERPRKSDQAVDSQQGRTQSPESKVPLSEQIRIAMRRVPTPLVAITAVKEDGKLAGLLASSFTTITIEPEPIVSFNIKLPSSTYDAITTSNEFIVNATSTIQMARKFLLSNYTPPGERPPRSNLSRWRRLGLFWMHCEWIKEKSIQVGDHMIMVGRVTSFSNNNEMGVRRMPLSWADGRFIQFYARETRNIGSRYLIFRESEE